MSYVLEKNVHPAVAGLKVPHMSVRSIWSVVLFKSTDFYFFACLVNGQKAELVFSVS